MMMQAQLMKGVVLIPWLLLGILALPLAQGNGHHRRGHRHHRHHNHPNSMDNTVENSIDNSADPNVNIDTPLYEPRNSRERCDLTGVPHHQGICGSRLAQLHSNICFLLRHIHPEFFYDHKTIWKRSVDGQTRASPKMSRVARVQKRMKGKYLEEVSMRTQLDQEIFREVSKYDPSITSLDKLADVKLRLFTLPGSSNNYKADIGIRHRHKVAKRSVRRKRSIVCECCMNACMAADIARYC